MPFIKIWIHAVWGTKNKEPFLVKEIKEKVITHIRENAKQKGIFIICIDGYQNHLHCLLGLNADMSIAKVMQLIKGESSFWINKEKITKEKFEWADEYYAASVSDSQTNNVKAYILNQENHHKKISFKEEYEKFLDSSDSESQG